MNAIIFVNTFDQIDSIYMYIQAHIRVMQTHLNFKYLIHTLIDSEYMRIQVIWHIIFPVHNFKSFSL